MNIFDVTHITSTDSDDFNELIDICIKDAIQDNLSIKDIKYSTTIKEQGIVYTHGSSEPNIIEYSALIIFKKK